MTDRHRKILKVLQITWTLLWTMATVLCLVCWLRSYWRMDRMTVTLPNQAPLRFLSWGAELVASHHGGSAVGYSYEFDTEIQWYKAMFPRPFNILGFRWLHNNGRTIGFAIPWWFPVLLSVILGVVPWISWSAQFNLRVLLLALTLLVLILTLVSFSYRAALRQERIYQHSIGEL